MNALANRSRRSFMKTLAGIGAASQFAGLFRDVWAQSTPTLPRFVVLSSPHGYPPTYWRPRAADGVGAAQPTGWTLDFPNSSLAPLQKHKDSLVIIEGLDLTTDTANPDFYTGGHNSLSVLTGWHPQGGESTAGQYKASGPSIDVAVAKLLNTTEFLFTPMGYGGAANTIGSFRADGSGIAAEYSLKKSLANWFGNVGTGAADPKAAARKNAQTAVLDYLGADARRLRGRLAGAEKAKLDAHLDALSGITQKISTPVSISCAKPTNAPDGDAVKPTGDKYIPIILDFTAQLLACNLTRVANVSIDPINSGAGALARRPRIRCSRRRGIHDDIAHGYRPERRQQPAPAVHHDQLVRAAGQLLASICLKAIPGGERNRLRQHDHAVDQRARRSRAPHAHQRPFPAGRRRRHLREGTLPGLRSRDRGQEPDRPAHQAAHLAREPVRREPAGVRRPEVPRRAVGPVASAGGVAL